MRGGLPPAFMANLNASNQTGLASATPTLVQFSNEVFDIGSFFNTGTYKWIPPAGYVNLSVRLYGTGALAAGCAGYIYKNGSILFAQQRNTISSSAAQLYLEGLDLANGTDEYTAYLSLTLSSGTGTVSGDITLTSFQGFWVSP